MAPQSEPLALAPFLCALFCTERPEALRPPFVPSRCRGPVPPPCHPLCIHSPGAHAPAHVTPHSLSTDPTAVFYPEKNRPVPANMTLAAPCFALQWDRCP